MCETSQIPFFPHPSRAPFSKFSLTFAHTYNSAFNIPFSSFQLCAMRFFALQNARFGPSGVADACG